MAEDDYFVDKSKIGIIFNYKERIRLLFDVTIQSASQKDDLLLNASVSDDNQIIPLENDIQSIRLSSIDSQENVTKAKVSIRSNRSNYNRINTRVFATTHHTISIGRIICLTMACYFFGGNLINNNIPSLRHIIRPNKSS